MSQNDSPPAVEIHGKPTELDSQVRLAEKRPNAPRSGGVSHCLYPQSGAFFIRNQSQFGVQESQRQEEESTADDASPRYIESSALLDLTSATE